MEEFFREQIKLITEIDKKLGILMQKNEDFTLINSKEHGEMASDIREHNGRLKRLEKWKYTAIGSITIITMLFGIFSNYVLSKLE